MDFNFGEMLNIIRVWILLSALLVASGWILSAFHQLNRIGYGIVFALAAIAFFSWQRRTKWRPPQNPAQSFHKFHRRCKRIAPLIFLALALLTLLAGALYASSNWDSNAYRIPRVLHWLEQEQWHWIRTCNAKMNIADCGFEWLSAPLILFTRTDRFIFLINWASYLMLPGLIFSVFTRLQVRPRVAWWWMWFLSSGWCFVFQARSDVNDSFTAIYALASVDFALRARASRRTSDLWLSLLAAALATGVKQTDIPLALLWVIAAWPAARLMLARPVGTAVVVAWSLLVSALPVTLFNLEHCGQWLPLDAAGMTGSMGKSHQLNSPLWAIAGNAFCLPVQNLLPPYFPWAGAWNEMMRRFLRTPFGAHFASFEGFGHVSPGISESSAGIGLGICAVILVSFFAVRRCRRLELGAEGRCDETDRRLIWLLRLVPWALLLLFMAKVGTAQNARQLAPYYVFLFPFWLVQPGHACLVRRRWWQQLVLLVMVVTAAMLVVAPDRPLFPARTIIGGLRTKFPRSKFVSQAWFYVSRPSTSDRGNYFRKDLPPQEPIVGYAAVFDADEPGLWLPYGSRRVERVLPEDTSEQLQSLGIHYVLVDDSFLVMENQTIEQWLGQYQGDLVDQMTYDRKLGLPAGHLYLVHLRPRREVD